MTLRSRLTLAFVLVVLTPLLVGLVVVTSVLPQAVARQQVQATGSTARLVGQVVQDLCARAQAAAELVGRAASTPDRAAARLAAQSLVDRRLADGVRVVGPSAAPVLAVGDLPARPVDCGTRVASLADGPWLSAVVPLTTPDRRAAGTAVASFALDADLTTLLRGAVGEGEVGLVDGAGRLVASTGRIDAAGIRRARAGDQAQHGHVVLAWYGPVRGQPFGVVVQERRAGVSTRLLELSLLVIAVCVLLAVGIAVLSARTTTQPLEELGQAAARIAAGDLSTVVTVRSTDEVGRLAGTLNAMSADLRRYVEQLQTSRRDLQAGLVRLGDTLSSTHDMDRILTVVLDSAMASTQASGGMVLLVSADRSQLVLAASRGLDVPHDLSVPMGQGLSGTAAVSGEAVRGIAGDSPGEHPPAPGEPAGRTVVAVPMTAAGRTIGVLDLFGSAAPGGFGDEDVATLRTFASQATVAVDNVLLHEQAQRLSLTDGLTGLGNYRLFTMTFSREIERATRFLRPLALLMLDVDHFKNVNDTYGHPRGDAILLELAARVRGCVRDVDTVARYGGEELVVVLPETGEQGAAQLAERICDAVRRKPFGTPGEPPVTVTVSVGVAVLPQHGSAASSLLARADEALYAAKHDGRDGWRMSPTGTAGRPH